MTNPTPAEFDDINEEVEEEWKAETTPYERVREVVNRIYKAQSADEISEKARTTPKTARKHLEKLADEGVVITETGKNGATIYRRSPESLVVEQAAEILDHVSTDELAERVAKMNGRITEFQAEYGVESPEELVVDQANQTLSEDVSESGDIDAEMLQEWKTTRRNLAFANAALSIANAERYVGNERDSSDRSALA